MPGSTGKHFLTGTDSAILPYAFSSVLSCVSLFSYLKHPTEMFQLWKVGQNKNDMKNWVL